MAEGVVQFTVNGEPVSLQAGWQVSKELLLGGGGAMACQAPQGMQVAAMST